MNISITPLVPADREKVVAIIRKQDNFLQCEIDIAIEVIDATFKAEEDYRTLVARDERQQLHGFISYGPVPLTENRFDLYWIAVDPSLGRHGIGTILLQEMEKDLRREGPGHIYIDTSSTEGYLAARRFYEKNDYQIVAHLKDFYRTDDNKIIYRKII